MYMNMNMHICTFQGWLRMHSRHALPMLSPCSSHALTMLSPCSPHGLAMPWFGPVRSARSAVAGRTAHAGRLGPEQGVSGKDLDDPSKDSVDGGDARMPILDSDSTT